MHTELSPEYAQRADALEAQAILKKCVHCGFCTATCPTYQLLGDELDGPRGRIYLIKQVLEGNKPTRKTQNHLDRCLTCRNCETTCPSGVDYGHLVDIGRKIVDEQVPRPAAEALTRWALKTGLPSPAFGPAMAVGQALRPLLPAGIQAKVPEKQSPRPWPVADSMADSVAHSEAGANRKQVLLLRGCVQPSMAPNINAAAARVLHKAGFFAREVPAATCCGAVKYHLNDHEGGKAHMRQNIDAWWPSVEANAVHAIVMTASGCGAMVKDYAHALKDDPAYAEKAKRISALTKDLSEVFLDPNVVSVLASIQSDAMKNKAKPKLVFHPPCTLQHGQKLRGGVETTLQQLGFDVQLASRDAHLCCGSAGTYSVLQPALATQLRDNKLAALTDSKPDTIISANIGCITHLQSGTSTPVRHWIEVLDDCLS
jgi:glycolate oxidase iron-sulfur subunit